MRILLLGSDKHYAIENFYVKYLRLSGVEVHQYAAQSKFYNYYYHSILNKILYKMGLSKILAEINSEILEQADSFKPDVVWVFKGMEIFPKTLIELKKKGILLANYNPDNPFLFSGKGSGNKNITQSIGLYDIHFTYSRSIQAQLQKTTQTKVFMLPFGYEIDEQLLLRVQKQEEVLKTCFLGNPDVYRADFLMKLAQNGIETDVYGHDWNKYISHPNIRIFPPVYGDEFWYTLYKYRVQLNLMRPHNEASHNMRTFEVPGVGGILLAPRTPEHEEFFVEDTEIFLYNDPEECMAKISKIMNFTKKEADQIRSNARLRSLRSGYRYKNRADFVVTALLGELKICE